MNINRESVKKACDESSDTLGSICIIPYSIVQNTDDFITFLHQR